MKPQDTITIAPSVLITIARQAALDVEGVSHMGVIPVDVGRLLRGQTLSSGVVLDVKERSVGLDLYLVVKPGTRMQETGGLVQQSVTRAIEDLVGMQVTRVDIHIEDVDYTPAEK